MDKVTVYINNAKTMVEIATGYGKYFKNIHFINQTEFNKARDFAYRAYSAFVAGILYKNTELIDEANCYTNKLTEIIEYNDPETFYGYEDTDYDIREDISTYEMVSV